MKRLKNMKANFVMGKGIESTSHWLQKKKIRTQGEVCKLPKNQVTIGDENHVKWET